MLQERDLPEHYRVWRREDGLRELKPGPIYKATDLRANRIVALRFFEGGDLDALGRRAARLLEATSPGIAALRDVFTKDQTLVAVTDYVVGESLTERVARRGPLAPELAWEMAERGIEALAALHARGVRHGQVGPSKILFPDDPRYDGVIRLVDCGLPRQDKTAPGEPQTDGEGLPDDFRRLGISLWFALTGAFPFGGNPGALTEDSPKGEALLAVLTALLCGEPDRQPDAARLLLETLRPKAEAVPPAASPVGETERAGTAAPAALPVATEPAESARPAEPARPAPAGSSLPSASPRTGQKPSPDALPAAVKPGTPPASSSSVPAAKSTGTASRENPPALAIPLPPASKGEGPAPVKTDRAAPIPSPPAPPKQATEKLSSGLAAGQGVPAQPTAAPVDGGETGKRRGVGHYVLPAIVLIGGGLAWLAYTQPWIVSQASRTSPPPPVSPSPALAEKVPAQPPRPVPVQARVDRIQEYAPSLLGVLQFAQFMERVTTVTLPPHSRPPDGAAISRLKDTFEWMQPSSPNFHRTAMLFVLGCVNDQPTGQAVAASQQCAEEWATALAHNGVTTPIYSCGLGPATGLPGIHAGAEKADRFVEVWVAFTAM